MANRSMSKLGEAAVITAYKQGEHIRRALAKTKIELYVKIIDHVEKSIRLFWALGGSHDSITVFRTWLLRDFALQVPSTSITTLNQFYTEVQLAFTPQLYLNMWAPGQPVFYSSILTLYSKKEVVL